MLRPCLSAIIFIAVYAINTPANAIIRCEFNGKPVNTANGAETAGLTGLIRCRESNTGHLQREFEIKDGQYVGQQRIYDSQGRLARERRVNDRGNTDGPDKTYWPNGRVKTEEVARNGQTEGIKKRYYEGGQLEDLLYYAAGQEVFAMAYYPEGHLYELRCPKQSVTPEDREPCGFSGPQQITLKRNDGRMGAQQTWSAGRLVANTSYREDGSQWQVHTLEKGERVHRVYSQEGQRNVLRSEERYQEDAQAFLTSKRGRLQSRKQWGANGVLIEETLFAEGREAQVLRWYLNGKLKESAKLEGTNIAQALRVVETFDDAGKPLHKNRITQQGARTGVQQSFHANGQLAQEDTYTAPNERGMTSLVRRKTWDEAGKQQSDDEILEDGSRVRQ